MCSYSVDIRPEGNLEVTEGTIVEIRCENVETITITVLLENGTPTTTRSRVANETLGIVFFEFGPVVRNSNGYEFTCGDGPEVSMNKLIVLVNCKFYDITESLFSLLTILLFINRSSLLHSISISPVHYSN